MGSAHLRLVSADWGPRGFSASFKQMRKKGFRPRQIVDVGAASGSWTRECLAVFPDAQYLLIDPLEENGAALDALARQHASVAWWAGAVGAQAGELSMIVHGDQSSFLSSEYATHAETSRRTIAVRTLDSFLDGEMRHPPDLIKADVQGYELEVLRGAARCMEFATALLLEVSFRRTYGGAPLAHEVIAFASQRGFRIHDICTYSQRPRDRELFQSDLLFVKDGSKVLDFEGYA